eukprot:1177632-Prorocentrum_minimum.AAC.3
MLDAIAENAVAIPRNDPDRIVWCGVVSAHRYLAKNPPKTERPKACACPSRLEPRPRVKITPQKKTMTRVVTKPMRQKVVARKKGGGIKPPGAFVQTQSGRHSDDDVNNTYV